MRGVEAAQRTGDWEKYGEHKGTRGMEDGECDCSYGAEMDLISGIR